MRSEDTLKDMLNDAIDALRDEGLESLADAVEVANARLHGGDDGPPSERILARTEDDHAMFLGH